MNGRCCGEGRLLGHGPRGWQQAVWAVLLMLTIAGCAATEEKGEALDTDLGQFTLYLNGPERANVDVTFRMEAVNIMAEDGTYHGVLRSPVEIRSIDMTDRQRRLAETALPAGKYTRIQLVISEASVTRKGRTATLALPPEGIELSVNAALGRGQNTTLFLIWDADASVSEGYLFRPSFAVIGERPELAKLLVFVTNEDSGNVSVINRQTGEVVATVRTGRGPRGIATGLLEDNLRVYVANSGSDSISVIDPATNETETEIPIRFGRKPEDVAVAKLSADRELVFVANYGSNTVSVVDPVTYEEFESVRVGNGPVVVATDPPVESFEGSRFLSIEEVNLLKSFRERFFNVYVANRESRDVSVLKVNKQSGGVEDVVTVEVDWTPVALSVDPERGRLYVVNYDSDKLSIIDIPQIVSNNVAGAVSTISDLQTSGIGVIADPSLDRLYLLVQDTGQIMLIRPSQEFLSPERLALTPIMGTIAVGASPRSLVMDPEGRKLYVVNRGSDTVSVIDKTTRRQERVVSVGRNPYGIAMFPEM